MDTREVVFVGCPSHDGRLDSGTALALTINATRNYQHRVAIYAGSLLARNCNTLWLHALSMNADWFAMLHGDVTPEDLWVDKLIDIAVKRNADLVSAIIPLKWDDGVTSTAISNPKDEWEVWTRLTQTQVHQMPETFDAQEAISALAGLPDESKVQCDPDSLLLVNTGCFVVRLKTAWTHKVHFEIRDTIREGRPETIPEDWNFSKQVAENGGKVLATRAVSTIHRGALAYSSKDIWGNLRDTEGGFGRANEIH